MFAETLFAMEEIGEDRERIPEKYKNHCMIGKYEYERIDKDTGKECFGVFFVGNATIAS